MSSTRSGACSFSGDGFGVGGSALLGRFTRRPVVAFRIVATAVLALSFVPPFALPGASTGMSMTLLLMHAVAAATTVFFLVTLATRKGQQVLTS